MSALFAHLAYCVTTGASYGSLVPRATANTDEEANRR